MSPPNRHNYKDKDYAKTAVLKVRLVRISLPCGEIEILSTVLLDRPKYPVSIFKELYFVGWGVETLYDELKPENCTKYSSSSVLQDFYCSFFIRNLQSVILNDLQSDLTKIAREKYIEK